MEEKIDKTKEKKIKTQGKPFPKVSLQGKLVNPCLSKVKPNKDKKEDCRPKEEKKCIGEPLNEENQFKKPKWNFKRETVKLEPGKDIVIGQNKEEKEMEFETTKSLIRNTPPSKDIVEDDIVDSLEFTNGSNNLKIVLSKKHNRMYRLQIVLNGETEIRPSTYTGTSPAMTFWKLLKGSVK